MKTTEIGEYAFLACIVIAVLAGLAIGAGSIGATTEAYVLLALVVLGIVVGLTSIKEKETSSFLMATIALLVANTGGVFITLNQIIVPLGTVVNSIVVHIAAFVAPAAIILSLKAVYNLARKT